MAINRNNFYEHLIEKQFNILEVTIIDALLNKNWRKEWLISQKQADDFKKYAIPLIKKVLKINKSKSEIAFEGFLKLHALNIKE